MLDGAGEIEHTYGITSIPGLYVIGLRFQRRRASHFIGGVGADAVYLAEHLTVCDHERRLTASRPCAPRARAAASLAALA